MSQEKLKTMLIKIDFGGQTSYYGNVEVVNTFNNNRT